MINEHIVFTKEALAAGMPRDAIRDALQQAGWSADETASALAAFADLPSPVPVPRRRPYLSAREAFVYLVLFLCLYLSAWSFGAVVFELINKAVPDPIAYGYGGETARLGVAMLFVGFPLYLWLSRVTVKWVASHPDKRQSLIRKWLTYLTLFVAAGVIIGGLVTLLYNLLGGDATARFLLKTVTVLAIAGLIFGYYLWDLRQDERE
jgi:hypothetical protein